MQICSYDPARWMRLSASSVTHLPIALVVTLGWRVDVLYYHLGCGVIRDNLYSRSSYTHSPATWGLASANVVLRYATGTREHCATHLSSQWIPIPTVPIVS
ncbi:hypothetical protein J6590_033797 [Homalodisca vitripennis]|nr:hypothetical protein J6590_033797 [Homalodisca vitripennis]